MLFFVPGASGAGKTAIIPKLKELLPEIAVYDFDVYPQFEKIGVLDSPAQRQRVAEVWIQQALQNNPQHTVVTGLGVMGEVFACPSALQVDHIAFCLLDCDDITRLDRIRQRGQPEYATIEILCWAAWLRVHHIDPQFRPDVINDGKNPDMVWERWSGWQHGHPHWRAHIINTTSLSISEVAEQVAMWVRSEQALYADGYRLKLV